ncbi:MAG: hypothetical protein CVV41_21440 [Candidatus Riflebacteria bacterium HGW-Riflebacteria-1]|jgi:hypothetical protein|nr:MAG: hypothetical protein CVV41_21440 [Candidatus Riflebacteria bacterium HGW-Riflebacteria-1]
MSAKKEQLHVTVYTPQHRIRGMLHLVQNSRLSDILNTESVSRDFLPITGASITDLRNDVTVQAPFISVNKKMIELVVEERDPAEQG